MKRVSFLLIKHVVYSYKNISDIVFCIKFAFKDNTFDGPKAMGRDPYGPTSIEMVTLITVSVPHDRRFGHAINCSHHLGLIIAFGRQH